MRRAEYLETREGQYHRRLSRRIQRQYFVVQDHEPKSKNAISLQEKIDFQQQILAQMKRFGRRAYRAKVVLQIDLCSQQNNPPSVYKLAKNYLDLMQEPVKGSGIWRRRVMLNDDRLVEVLIVNYWLRPEISGAEIQIRVDALRNFIEDLQLLERVRRNDFRDGSMARCDEVWDEYDHERPAGRLSEVMAQLRDWQQSRADVEVWWGKDAYAGMERAYRMQAQGLYLEARQPGLRELLAVMAPHLHAGCDPELSAILEQTRDMMITPPFMLDLTHAPSQTGERAIFRSAVAEALESFKRSHPILFPLLATMGVTVFCVPPARQSSDGRHQYVDLDNLACYVIPSVHDVLEPPSATVHTVDVESIKDPARREFFQQHLGRLARTPKISVTQYQVIRLPRTAGDPDQGLVRLALGDGRPGSSLWERVDDVLDAWADRVRRHR